MALSGSLQEALALLRVVVTPRAQVFPLEAHIKESLLREGEEPLASALVTLDARLLRTLTEATGEHPYLALEPLRTADASLGPRQEALVHTAVELTLVRLHTFTGAVSTASYAVALREAREELPSPELLQGVALLGGALALTLASRGVTRDAQGALDALEEAT